MTPLCDSLELIPWKAKGFPQTIENFEQFCPQETSLSMYGKRHGKTQKLQIFANHAQAQRRQTQDCTNAFSISNSLGPISFSIRKNALWSCECRPLDGSSSHFALQVVASCCPSFSMEGFGKLQKLWKCASPALRDSYCWGCQLWGDRSALGKQSRHPSRKAAMPLSDCATMLWLTWTNDSHLHMAMDLRKVTILWTLWMEEILHQLVAIGNYETL